jgi:outer membrane protein assembly factor BamB
MPDTGFRVVRCKAGTHPPDGAEPLRARTVLEIDPNAYDPLAGACHRYSLLRNAVFPDPGVPDAPHVSARFQTPGPVRSSPVVVEGIAYVGSRPKPGARLGALHAVDVATMRELWTLRVPGGVDSSPCVHDGTVYVGGRDGKLYAVAAGREGGKVRWAVQASSGPLDGAPGVAYGTVFVLVGGYGPHTGVRGFGADDGEMAYLYREHPWPGAAVCLTPTLALCTHSAGTRVSAGRLADEMNAWASPVPSYGRNDVVVADGVVYGVLGGGKIGGYREPGHIAAIDPNTGNQFWKRALEAHVDRSAYCFSSPVVWGGKVFVGMDNGFLHVYDARTGRPTDWRIRATDPAGKPVAIRTSPSVSGPTGVVYFGAADGAIRAIDGRTGRLRWSLPLGDGPIDSSAWVAGRSVLVGTPAGLVKIAGER